MELHWGKEPMSSRKGPPCVGPRCFEANGFLCVESRKGKKSTTQANNCFLTSVISWARIDSHRDEVTEGEARPR